MAAKLGLDRQTVGKWRRRFMEQRVAGCATSRASGAPRTIDDARIEAVIVRRWNSGKIGTRHSADELWHSVYDTRQRVPGKR